MRFFGTFLRAFAVATILLAALDATVRVGFPISPRLHENFSAAYLRRVLAPENVGGHIVVLGDSVLWGYRLLPSQTAVARLQDQGRRFVNLSFEGGSTPNTYAMVKLIEGRAAPRAIVFNVNSKEFNAADSAYRTLHPAVEQLAWDHLSQDERELLKRTLADTPDARIDRFVGRYWILYGMRTDIRERLFGNIDLATALVGAQHRLSGEAQREAEAHRPTAERFLGTYDLAPLEDRNVGVQFLRRTLATLRAHHIPAYVILTPTNHRLLHDYIDVPEYRHNLAFLVHLARSGGAQVLDYDSAFTDTDFIDNDHLTAEGNAKFAAMLTRDIKSRR